MPPKLRDRSSSRSRTAATSAPVTPATSSASSAKKTAKSTSKMGSKSPARARGATSKSPSRARTPKQPKQKGASTSSASRSRSRGRPPKAATPHASNGRFTARSRSRSRSAQRNTPRSTPRSAPPQSPSRASRSVVRTAEVADDEITPNRPILRQRLARNLTQDPPTTADRAGLRTSPRVFGSPSKAAQSKGCVSCFKTNAVWAKNQTVQFLTRAFNFLYWAITFPFIYLRNLWNENKPRNEKMAAAMLFVLFLLFSVVFVVAFPDFCHRSWKWSEKHITLPSRRFMQTTYGKIAVWSENVHKWSQNHWQSLTEKLNNKATQTP